MSLSLFTNWTVGVLNGYMQKDGGLPRGISYGTMGVTTFTMMIRMFGNLDETNVNLSPRQKFVGMCIAAPLIIATNFCVGHHLGKAISYVKDKNSN